VDAKIVSSDMPSSFKGSGIMQGKKNEMGWACGTYIVRRGGCIGSWWGKPEGRRSLGRYRRRWVDNIRTDLQEVGCGYTDWIGLAQDRDR